MTYTHPIKTLILSAMVSATMLNAEGIIGNDFTEISAGYIDYGSVNSVDVEGKSLSIVVNESAKKTDSYGLDFYVGATWQSVDDIDLDQYDIAAGGIIYLNPDSKVRPYVDLGLGYYFISGIASDDSFLLSAAVGVEIEVYEDVTVSPQLSYVNAPDGDVDETSFAVKAAYWFSSSFFGSLTYTYADSDSGDNANAVTLGVGFSY